MGDYRQLLGQVHEHIDQGLRLGDNLTIPKNTKRIVFCGMGGSGIAGNILATFLEFYEIEVVVNKTADLPKHLVNSNTVVVICSYSGNTAETLSCYRSAVKGNYRVLVISSGGTLLASAQRQKLQHIIIPGGYLPRQAFMFQFFSVLQVLINSELIPVQTTAINEFKRYLDDYPFARRSNAIAKTIDNTFPVIYTSPALEHAGTRWKTQVNENAKTLCFTDVFTEVNHNGIEGFDNQVKGISLFILKLEREKKLIEKQIDAFSQLVRSQVENMKVYDIPGRSMLTSLLIAIHLGDWVSYQLAEMKGVDADPVAMIQQLKSQL
ncbi:MAG: bifunctional phosphoglucose/phosphomannose isomerase [Nanoarchaeota archaeon]